MQADKQQISRLLKTARGQIDGVLKMVEEDQYCINIANQVMAAQAVLRKVNNEILRAHMNGCVVTAMEAGDEGVAREKIEELIGVIGKLAK